jgi:hypothetical protein
MTLLRKQLPPHRSSLPLFLLQRDARSVSRFQPISPDYASLRAGTKDMKVYSLEGKFPTLSGNTRRFRLHRWTLRSSTEKFRVLERRVSASCFRAMIVANT